MELSFYEQRMQALGVTKENNKITLRDDLADIGSQVRPDVNIFSEDKEGNIVITFYNIEGYFIQYEKKGNGKMSDVNAKWVLWRQKRLKIPVGDKKYELPKGGGVHPFFPPIFLEAYRTGAQIDTLYITEGAFKAWKASLYGAYVIGLTSITHYRNSETKKIHSDILSIIKKCKVKNLVTLWDGDCLNISEKQLYEKIDITKRPKGFFHAARNIQSEIKTELLTDEIELNYYFMHVQPESFDDKPKGLDDLLIAAEEEDRAEQVIKEMHKLEKKDSYYFKKLNITLTTSLLARYFALDPHDVTPFYNRFIQIIGSHQFNYYGSFFQYSEVDQEVKMIAPGWARGIRWIGDNFFKIVKEPSANGTVEIKMLPRTKSSLQDELRIPKFYTFLDHYEGFCNIPDHINYKPVHHNFYNRYFPFTHKAEEGEYQTTIDFFKHIFGEREIDYKGKKLKEYELGLDYFQILYEKPTQMLPVMILYSAENQTGKSTWGKFLKYAFGHNATQVNNNDFQSDFNEHFTDKLIAICEETLLERKKEVERIKAWTTSDRMMVNPKGTKQYEIDFFCKFLFFSNNKRMIYLTKHDTRFWILQVPLPKTDNPNMLAVLKSEFPAFLKFIQNRKLATQNEGRMWFKSDMLRNDMFYQTVQVNEPSHARKLRSEIRSDFLDFGEKEILMPLNEIAAHYFSKKVEKPYLKELLSDYLQVEQLKTKDGKTKQVRGYYYRWEDSITLEGSTERRRSKVIWNGRPYVFKRSDFVDSMEELDLENKDHFEDLV